MGTRTDAAHAEVLRARAELDGEIDRLEAAGRAAVDIPAKVRRAPAKAAGVAAGTAFVALGGPKRLFRRARRAVTGEEEELPSELLPKEVDKAQRARFQKDDPLAFQVLSTQLEHTDKMCGNWRLGNDSRVKDGFWPEFQSAMLGRKDAKTALADAERRVSRELRRA